MSKQQWSNRQRVLARKARLIGSLLTASGVTLGLAVEPARATTIPYQQVTLPADARIHPGTSCVGSREMQAERKSTPTVAVRGHRGPHR
jgi:hypothetical protein